MRQPWLFVALLLVGACATWLLLAGPDRVLGIDAGNLGVFALITASWGSLIAVSRLPQDGIESAISPGEWRAWIAFAFTVVIAAYAITHVGAFQGPPLWQNPDAQRVGRTIALMVIAWVILFAVLRQRWHGRVQEDERDREIEARASEWARVALSVLAIALAVLLGFTPSERLEWAPPPVIAHLIVLALIGASLVEYGYTALAYWRDRH